MKIYKLAIAAAGAVAGFVAGILLAPRSGAETRAMASDAVNDAWDSAIDTYERGQQAVSDKIGTMRPNVDATTDELRAKVDLARERMDQLRDSLTAVTDEEAPAEEVEVTVEAGEEAPAVEAAAEEVTDEAKEEQAEDADAKKA